MAYSVWKFQQQLPGIAYRFCSEVKDGYKQKLTVNEDEIDGLAPDEIGERLHHRENCRNPGYIIYTVRWAMQQFSRMHIHVVVMYMLFTAILRNWYTGYSVSVW